VISMYAIPNCDTVKKARAFLDKKKIAYEFVDFKKSPPDSKLIKTWSEFFGELPVNKKGLTYKKLKDEYEALSNSEKINFITHNTSMIKRPVLMKDGKTVAIGFEEDVYKAIKF
jgi:arsenate reductase (glutaredoxin)